MCKLRENAFLCNINISRKIDWANCYCLCTLGDNNNNKTKQYYYWWEWVIWEFVPPLFTFHTHSYPPGLFVSLSLYLSLVSPFRFCICIYPPCNTFNYMGMKGRHIVRFRCSLCSTAVAAHCIMRVRAYACVNVLRIVYYTCCTFSGDLSIWLRLVLLVVWWTMAVYVYFVFYRVFAILYVMYDCVVSPNGRCLSLFACSLSLSVSPAPFHPQITGMAPHSNQDTSIQYTQVHWINICVRMMVNVLAGLHAGRSNNIDCVFYAVHTIGFSWQAYCNVQPPSPPPAERK